MLPVRPSAVMGEFGSQLQDLLAKEMQEMQDEMAAEDEPKDGLFRSTRAIFKNNNKILFAVRTGVQGPEIDQLIQQNTANVAELLEKIDGNPLQRNGPLGNAITVFTETRMMQHFFDTGTLPARN